MRQALSEYPKTCPESVISDSLGAACETDALPWLLPDGASTGCASTGWTRLEVLIESPDPQAFCRACRLHGLRLID